MFAVTVYIAHPVMILLSSFQVYHHTKLYHCLVVSGSSILPPLFTDIDGTASHEFVLNVTVRLHDVAGVTNQFGSTQHLHGWLSENVFLSLFGAVTHDTKSETFLFKV